MTYEIIKEINFEKTRKLIGEARNKKKLVIFNSDNDELNRKIIEKEKIEGLLINLSGRKDFQKQRNSGFNQVMAKIAKRQKILIGINFDEIIESSKSEKTKILLRIIQNIKICNKYKLEIVFIIQKKENQRESYDLKALGLTLGTPTWMKNRSFLI